MLFLNGLNKLQLNSSKSKVLPIWKGNFQVNLEPVIINNETIELVGKVRNLGFFIRSDFSWVDHTNNICSRVYAGLKLLRKFSSFTPLKTRRNLAFSLLISHFIYSDIVMARLNCDSKRSLQVVFNSITRYVYNVSRYAHITPF